MFYSAKEMERYMQNDHLYWCNPLFLEICGYYPNIDIFQYLLPIFRRYWVGVMRDDRVIYWQHDINEHCNAGKVMRYELYGNVDYRHGVKWLFHNPQGTSPRGARHPFGTHLLAHHPAEVSVAVVESEYAALMGATYNLLYLRGESRLPLFIANGGVPLSLTLSYLKGRHVTLFPPHGKEQQWLEQARPHTSHLRSLEMNTLVQQLVVTDQLPPGSDYATLLATQLRTRQIQSNAKKKRIPLGKFGNFS